MTFSKLSHTDAFEIYRTVYSSKIDWEDIFEDDIIRWFEKGKNCSLFLTVPALLAMTGAFLGPNTKIKGQSNGFTTCKDLYLLAVCDPGGGKSTTFGNVVEPVMNNILEKNRQKLVHRIIQNSRITKASNCLRGSSEGTFLVESGMQDFVDVYYKMFMDHQDGKEYSLTDEAQKEYDELVDSYADLLDDKYKAVSDELQELEKENFGMLHKIGKPRKEIFHKSSPSQMPIELLGKVKLSLEEYTSKFKSQKNTENNVLM
ncbi:unnamed protein product [Mytilus coruscus]|uniref:Uncharacterized protein n=1 Tax=Mytilus coruscus TaxID=42192 RepID=A0A6J8E943_MYTCO|nr:unnamed protein product [Mytilus coruscus]